MVGGRQVLVASQAGPEKTRPKPSAPRHRFETCRVFVKSPLSFNDMPRESHGCEYLHQLERLSKQGWNERKHG